jgi:SSS family solute:Na+ symporter
MPFMDRVLYVFLACCGIMLLAGLLERKPQAKAIALGDISFRTGLGYNAGAAVVLAMLAAVYTVFW